MEIVQEMPEVDGVLGTGSYYDIVSAVGKVLAGELVSESATSTPLSRSRSAF